jgi:hypothetical protein
MASVTGLVDYLGKLSRELLPLEPIVIILFELGFVSTESVQKILYSQVHFVKVD